jgi:hypothetical protein
VTNVFSLGRYKLPHGFNNKMDVGSCNFPTILPVSLKIENFARNNSQHSGLVRAWQRMTVDSKFGSSWDGWCSNEPLWAFGWSYGRI